MALPVDYRSLSPQEKKAIREEYARRQDMKCAHCGEPLSGNARTDIAQMKVNRRLFPESFFRWPVHLHHCHKTGLTIGAVHNQCNAVLWQYHGE